MTLEEVVWNTSPSNLEVFGGQIEHSLDDRLQPVSGKDWRISSESNISEFSGTEKAVIDIKAFNPGSKKKYLHIAYFCPSHGFERLLSIVSYDVNLESRVQLEKHRQKIVCSILDAASRGGWKIGSPKDDLELVVESDPSLFE